MPPTLQREIRERSEYTEETVLTDGADGTPTGFSDSLTVPGRLSQSDLFATVYVTECTSKVRWDNGKTSTTPVGDVVVVWKSTEQGADLAVAGVDTPSSTYVHQESHCQSIDRWKSVC